METGKHLDKKKKKQNKKIKAIDLHHYFIVFYMYLSFGGIFISTLKKS